MKLVNTLVLIFCIFNSTLASAGSSDVSDFPYLDMELLRKHSQPSMIIGSHAKAISVAIDSFSSSGLMEYRAENYLVLVSEVSECYFVQIRIPATKLGASVPFNYCVNKNTYELGEVPAEIKVGRKKKNRGQTPGEIGGRPQGPN